MLLLFVVNIFLLSFFSVLSLKAFGDDWLLFPELGHSGPRAVSELSLPEAVRQFAVERQTAKENHQHVQRKRTPTSLHC